MKTFFTPLRIIAAGAFVALLILQAHIVSSFFPNYDAPRTGPHSVEITINATHYVFYPEKFVVKKGDTVVIHLQNKDKAAHGFSIPDLSIIKYLPPGATETITFTAETAGHFLFFCNVWCGEWHARMDGIMVVEE